MVLVQADVGVGLSKFRVRTGLFSFIYLPGKFKASAWFLSLLLC